MVSDKLSWTLRRTWPGERDDDFEVMRGEDRLGRIYVRGGSTGSQWSWIVQVVIGGDFKQGLAPDLASAKAAFRAAISDLIRTNGPEAFESAVEQRRRKIPPV
jgi:hypothetical protein